MEQWNNGAIEQESDSRGEMPHCGLMFYCSIVRGLLASLSVGNELERY